MAGHCAIEPATGKLNAGAPRSCAAARNTVKPNFYAGLIGDGLQRDRRSEAIGILSANRRSAGRPDPVGQSPGKGNTRAMVYVAVPSEKNTRKRNTSVATDYDEVRSDVKESQDRSLEALQSASAPDARSVIRELDETDALDEAMTPGGEFVAEELIVQVIPQAKDEFTCYSCFLVRHRSQLARERDGHPYCIECAG